MRTDTPIMNKAAFGKGILAGALVGGSIFFKSHLALNGLAFIFGLIIALDALIPPKNESYAPVTTVAAMFVSFLFSVIFTGGGINWYFIILLSVSVVAYLYKVIRKAGFGKESSEEQ